MKNQTLSRTKVFKFVLDNFKKLTKNWSKQNISHFFAHVYIFVDAEVPEQDRWAFFKSCPKYSHQIDNLDEVLDWYKKNIKNCHTPSNAYITDDVLVIHLNTHGFYFELNSEKMIAEIKNTLQSERLH